MMSMLLYIKTSDIQNVFLDSTNNKICEYKKTIKNVLNSVNSEWINNNYYLKDFLSEKGIGSMVINYICGLENYYHTEFSPTNINVLIEHTNNSTYFYISPLNDNIDDFIKFEIEYFKYTWQQNNLQENKNRINRIIIDKTVDTELIDILQNKINWFSEDFKPQLSSMIDDKTFSYLTLTSDNFSKKNKEEYSPEKSIRLKNKNQLIYKLDENKDNTNNYSDYKNIIKNILNNKEINWLNSDDKLQFQLIEQGVGQTFTDIIIHNKIRMGWGSDEINKKISNFKAIEKINNDILCNKNLDIDSLIKYEEDFYEEKNTDILKRINELKQTNDINLKNMIETLVKKINFKSNDEYIKNQLKKKNIDHLLVNYIVYNKCYISKIIHNQIDTNLKNTFTLEDWHGHAVVLEINNDTNNFIKYREQYMKKESEYILEKINIIKNNINEKQSDVPNSKTLTKSNNNQIFLICGICAGIGTSAAITKTILKPKSNLKQKKEEKKYTKKNILINKK